MKAMAPANSAPVPTDSFRLDRTFSLSEQVYRFLRDGIVLGRLHPGQSINEALIANALGVSRTPVREAVKRICDEGLVKVVAQSGTFVAGIDRLRVEQAYIVRRALEAETVARCVEFANEEALAELDTIIARHERATKTRRFEDAIRHDDSFHRLIAMTSGLDIIWQLTDRSKAQMDRVRFLTTHLSRHAEATISEHRAILEAIRAKDRPRAVEAMQIHLQRSFEGMIQYIDRPTVALQGQA